MTSIAPLAPRRRADRMLATVLRGYGDGFEIAERAIPCPARGQVLVRVHASSINPLDAALASGALSRRMALEFPATLGFDLAGEVAALGEGVTRFAEGHRVYGRVDARTGGAHAQYAVVNGSVLDEVPQSLSWEQAAALPLTAMTAVQGVRALGLRAGERLLINGGAGGVGVAVVQIARAIGAEVTVIASTDARPLLGRLGASRIIDRQRADLPASAERFDAIFDAAARHPWGSLRRLLTPRGRFVSTGISVGLAVHAVLGRLWSRRRAHFIVSRADGSLMRAVSDQVARGHLEAVIDRVVSLERIADGYRRLAAGGVRGKIVVAIAQEQ